MWVVETRWPTDEKIRGPVTQSFCSIVIRETSTPDLESLSCEGHESREIY